MPGPLFAFEARRTDARSRRFALALCGLAATWHFAGAQPALAKEPPCNLTEKREADKWLWLNKRDKALSLKQNLPWGVPKEASPPADERILIHWDYVIWHDDRLRVPLWTGERVIGAALGKAKRKDCFRADPRLPASAAATDKDYDEPIFDQGHITPSADVTTSTISVLNSFIMSNMTPQFCQFNRGVWQILEELVRRWSAANGTINVISGSIFDKDADGQRDADEDARLMTPRHGKKRVAIPTSFFKIIAAEGADGRVRTLSFILPHDQVDHDGDEALAYLTAHIATIDAIEKLTGFDFMAEAPAIDETTSLWAFEGKPPRTLANSGTQCKATAGAVID